MSNELFCPPLTLRNEYISFWNLRSYDRINAPKEYIKKMEEASGVSFHEAQVALARLYVGGPRDEAEEDEVVYIEKPHDQLTQPEDTNKNKKTAQEAVPLPKTVEEVSVRRDKAFSSSISGTVPQGPRIYSTLQSSYQRVQTSLSKLPSTSVPIKPSSYKRPPPSRVPPSVYQVLSIDPL